jgi:hypothetical protein
MGTRQRQYNRRNPKKIMFLNAKRRAKERGKRFEINEDDIVIPEMCPILGVRLVPGDKHQRRLSPSLDEIVPGVGYIRGNIQVISQRANVMKTDASPEELNLFSNWIRKTYAATIPD